MKSSFVLEWSCQDNKILAFYLYVVDLYRKLGKDSAKFFFFCYNEHYKFHHAHIADAWDRVEWI